MLNGLFVQRVPWYTKYGFEPEYSVIRPHPLNSPRKRFLGLKISSSRASKYIEEL